MDTEIHGGSIRVRDDSLESVAPDGAVVWRWRPPAMRVIGIAAISGTTDAIVLAEPLSSLPRGAPTLFRCHPDGTLSWTAEVSAEGDGTYVSVTSVDDEIAANTWDGRRVMIDVGSGKITGVLFTK